MQEQYECPFCSSDLTRPTVKHFEGELVIWCVSCSSFFMASSGDVVVPVADGGDDEFDEDRAPAADDQSTDASNYYVDENGEYHRPDEARHPHQGEWF